MTKNLTVSEIKAFISNQISENYKKKKLTKSKDMQRLLTTLSALIIASAVAVDIKSKLNANIHLKKTEE